MPHPRHTPMLRLVSASAAAAQPLSLRSDTLEPAPTAVARGRVAQENRSAAAMSASDVRWVFAAAVADQLEGGIAAVLSPERRRRLQSVATRLGLRPFDANLVIAIVQDSARQGDATLGPDTSSLLDMIRPVQTVGSIAANWVRDTLPWAFACVALAFFLAVLMARWIAG